MTMIDIIKKLIGNPPESEIQINDPGMRERNEARMAKIKEEMGEKWILHPAHTKTRLEEPRPV